MSSANFSQQFGTLAGQSHCRVVGLKTRPLGQDCENPILSNIPFKICSYPPSGKIETLRLCDHCNNCNLMHTGTCLTVVASVRLMEAEQLLS